MKEGYRLVWADEFEQNGKPDAEKWTLQTGGKWANNELQAYTDRLTNAFVRDGRLYLRALKEEDMGRSYTSARMMTYPHAAWQYGYFEVRAKIPCGIGSWPAIWFMPVASRQGVRWPLCGEIDMMEHSMREPDVLFYSLHTEKMNHMRPPEQQRTTKLYSPGATHEFRTYAMEWTPDKIEYFLDGESVCRYDRNGTRDVGIWPFDQPFYMILNVAIGGFFGGPVKEEDLPYEMTVDYVRVYQKEDTGKA